VKPVSMGVIDYIQLRKIARLIGEQTTAVASRRISVVVISCGDDGSEWIAARNFTYPETRAGFVAGAAPVVVRFKGVLRNTSSRICDGMQDTPLNVIRVYLPVIFRNNKCSKRKGWDKARIAFCPVVISPKILGC